MFILCYTILQQASAILGNNEYREGCREYSSTTRIVNYSSNFLLLEYSLISISGCKFPFPVAVFLQSIDELLEFKQTWSFAISFATCQP